MLSVIERQVFDFLGYLWIPILVNFFEIIFIILGFFGAYQYRPKYIISYILWHLFWLGWNIFIICLYLDVANLDHKTNKVLKLDPKSESWWSNEGPGCKKVLNESEKAASENCLVNYVHVEIFQAGLQCFTALIGIVIGTCLSRMFLEEDDTFNYEDAKGPEYLSLHPMYVSPSDCLNQHFSKSNTQLNVKSTDLQKPLIFRKNSGKRKNNLHADAIRYIKRSSSFDVLNAPNNKRSKNRPKSMTSRSYLDSDLNF